MSFISRFGVLGYKVGSSRFIGEKKTSAVTLVNVPGCVVLRTRDGSDYVSLALGMPNTGKLNKPQQVELEKKSLPLCKKIVEFRVAKDEAVEVGGTVGVEWIAVGDFVDVTGTAAGKGFQGGMKRHGFDGMCASHGVSVSHRAIGSTGTREQKNL